MHIPFTPIRMSTRITIGLCGPMDGPDEKVVRCYISYIITQFLVFGPPLSCSQVNKFYYNLVGCRVEGVDIGSCRQLYLLARAYAVL